MFIDVKCLSSYSLLFAEQLRLSPVFENFISLGIKDVVVVTG